jgi:hypothetical protein
MSIKTDATVIKNETIKSANTAVRVGTLLENIADDLTAKQTLIDTNTSKVSFDASASAKLTGIEAGATADQSNAEIKTAYEANADTNAFTDAEKTKVANTSGTNTGDQTIPVSGVDFDPVGTDNSDNNAVNTLYSGLAASKQDTISLTTTETSGAATLVGSTLNIPQYAGGGGGDTINNYSSISTPQLFNP